MFHNVTWSYTSASKTPIPQYNLSVKVVPENAPDSILDSLKTKISWGGMPPDPPSSRVLSHTDLWFAPPIFIKLDFCPPLQHFLNEGLSLQYYTVLVVPATVLVVHATVLVVPATVLYSIGGTCYSIIQYWWYLLQYHTVLVVPATILLLSNGSKTKSMTLATFCSVGTVSVSRRPGLLSCRGWT